MSFRLSRRRSAPTLLLNLSPLSETHEEFQLRRNHIKCLRNSQSAPSLIAPTKDSFSSQEVSRENTVCKKDHKVSIRAGSGSTTGPLTNNSPANPAQKTASVIIGNDSQQQQPVTTISSSRIYAEPLREFVPTPSALREL